MIVASLSTRSHAARAVVALESAQKHNEDISEGLLLLVDGTVTPAWSDRTSVRVIGLADLCDARFERMQRYYTVHELCCALKPWLLRYVDFKTDAQRWLYVDADTWCVGELSAVHEALDSADVVFTYHASSPSCDASSIARDLTLSRHGSVNAGFIGANRSPTVTKFSSWWLERLVSHGRNKPSEGEYCDQLWLTLALAHFPRARGRRIPGVNIGHWNLHELSCEDGRLLDRGRPIAMPHFSQIGLSPTGPSFSGLPNRSTPASPTFERLARDYCQAVNVRQAALGECLVRAPAPPPLDRASREYLLQAVHGSDDEDAAFRRAARDVPLSRFKLARMALLRTGRGLRRNWRSRRA